MYPGDALWLAIPVIMPSIAVVHVALCCVEGAHPVPLLCKWHYAASMHNSAFAGDLRGFDA